MRREGHERDHNGEAIIYISDFFGVEVKCGIFVVLLNVLLGMTAVSEPNP